MISLARYSNTPASHVNVTEKNRRVQFTVKKETTPICFITAGKKALNSWTKSTIRPHNTKRKFGFLETNSTFRPETKRIRSDDTSRKPSRLQFLFEKELSEPETLTLPTRRMDHDDEIIEKRKVVLFDPEFDEAEADNEEKDIAMEAVAERRTWELPASTPMNLLHTSELDFAKPHIPNVFGASSPHTAFKAPGRELDDMSIESYPSITRSPSPDSINDDAPFYNGESFHMGEMSPIHFSEASDHSESELSIISGCEFGDSIFFNDSDQGDSDDQSTTLTY